MVDTTAQLNSCLLYKEMRANLELAHSFCIGFIIGVTQRWDFWVMPLALDAMLGTPWFKRVLPVVN